MHLDDLEIMRAVLEKGDKSRSAMATIYRNHFNRLMRNIRMAYPRLSEADAADFVAQGFINAFTRAGSYRGECALQTWLLRIVRNLVIDAARHEAVAPMLGEADSDEARYAWENASALEQPQDEVMRRQLDDCVRNRFLEFRLKHPLPAWALWARLGEDMNSEDIALLLDKTYGATRQYLSDWAKKLRKALAPCLPHLLPE